ncbi:hypothetical protein PO878_04530 [Iamia majanohamensis]|uniref:Uncharacterized protein n=1 Tax=Iamia majanohamensis TaxID=467976 RepID=A0AAF0BWY1_9ACTN|nr:hypothetical protein [Iamia majanohamensis]WCO67989.1 hypothetical protein PO878_04530 [Iamia majanohamensis]
MTAGLMRLLTFADEPLHGLHELAPRVVGSMVRADRVHVVRSLEDPQVEVVDRSAPIMPAVGLDEDRVGAVVTYIEELT